MTPGEAEYQQLKAERDFWRSLVTDFLLDILATPDANGKRGPRQELAEAAKRGLRGEYGPVSTIPSSAEPAPAQNGKRAGTGTKAWETRRRNKVASGGCVDVMVEEALEETA